jgi:hypothetical protein
MKDFLKAFAAWTAFLMISAMSVSAMLNGRFSHAIILGLCAGVIWYLSNEATKNK